MDNDFWATQHGGFYQRCISKRLVIVEMVKKMVRLSKEVENFSLSRMKEDERSFRGSEMAQDCNRFQCRQSLGAAQADSLSNPEVHNLRKKALRCTTSGRKP